MSVGKLAALNDILKPVNEAGSDNTLTEKETRPHSLPEENKRNRDRANRQALKKKEAIDAANPETDKKTLERCM